MENVWCSINPQAVILSKLLSVDHAASFYFYRGDIHMRKGFDSLSGIVASQMKCNPFTLVDQQLNHYTFFKSYRACNLSFANTEAINLQYAESIPHF